MSDMIFNRVYRGTIIGMAHISTDEFGTRHYQIHFKGGMAFFAYPRKRTLPVAVGATIRFCGHWRGDGKYKHYVIDDVLNSTYMDQLESAEQQRKVQILMEESYEQRDI